MRRLRKVAGEEPLRSLLDEVSRGSKDPYRAALDIISKKENLNALLSGNGKARS